MAELTEQQKLEIHNKLYQAGKGMIPVQELTYAASQLCKDNSEENQVKVLRDLKQFSTPGVGATSVTETIAAEAVRDACDRKQPIIEIMEEQGLDVPVTYTIKYIVDEENLPDITIEKMKSFDYLSKFVPLTIDELATRFNKEYDNTYSDPDITIDGTTITVVYDTVPVIVGDVVLGGIVQFGRFVQSSEAWTQHNPDLTDPISWYVININSANKEVWLISEKSLWYEKWAIDDNGSYKDSPVNSWLNNEFFNTAFNSDEKKAIMDHEITISGPFGTDNPDYYVGKKKVFLVSYEEWTTYLKGKQYATCTNTSYSGWYGNQGISGGVGMQGSNDKTMWMLRTLATDTTCYHAIFEKSTLNTKAKTTYCAIRPCIKIKYKIN